MTYDISRVPFSYFGSWMSIAVPARERALYLRNHHMRANNLFTLEAVTGGKAVTPAVDQTPSRLVLTAGEGRVEVCFDGPNSVRLRGENLGFRFTGERIHAYRNGERLAVFNLRKAFRRYQFEVLAGCMELRGAYASVEEDLENQATHQGGGDFSLLDDADVDHPALHVVPDASGRWEVAIDEFWSTWERPERNAFDDCLRTSEAAFGAFRDSLTEVPEALCAARDLAAYVNWSCTVAPAGLVKRPTLFMSKNWMNNVWSWDQCFNAMALARGQPALALDQMLTLVDHQDAFGAYPDAFNDMEIHYNFSKPPVHGFAFSELLDRLPERPGSDVMETMVRSLGRQAEWWMTHRQSALALPYYLHGNDSGWDNSTMFAQGVPLVAPDLSALLVLQMDVLARLSGELGRTDEARRWKDRAEALFATLMTVLWTGDHFVAKLANTGESVESQSLIPWLPLLLGERLPQTVRDCLKRGIEGHLTDWGLATERVDSACYIADGYWRGPIWAPSTYLAVAGLRRAGHPELAAEIAARFCRLCAKSGFAENFDALSGEPLRDPAYTWTASVFLLLAEAAVKGFAAGPKQSPQP